MGQATDQYQGKTITFCLEFGDFIPKKHYLPTLPCSSTQDQTMVQ